MDNIGIHPTARIHPTAIIEQGAIIGAGSEIGPYCIIGGDVVLAENVCLIAHVCISGATNIGAGTVVYPFAALGYDTPDLKYQGEKSRLRIGKNNKIREYVTIHPGTAADRMETTVGDGCLIMVGAHIAHDCVVEDEVILSNYVNLGGHVRVGKKVIIGGLSGIHQHVRIGKHAMIGGMSAVSSDVVPFGLVRGDRASLEGLNLVGLKRSNFDKRSIILLREAFNLIFISEEGMLRDRVTVALEKFGKDDVVKDMLDFLIESHSRSICLPKNHVFHAEE